jgi:DNA-binding MarR family transcriptional regulator
MMETSRTELVERFVELMGRMSGHMRSRTPVEWSELELTMPQARTLFFLSNGPARMGDLSAYLGSGMPSATSMIDRLVKKGLVERIKDASDRRVVACRLTEAGTEVVERFWRIGRMRREEMAGSLTLEELEVVVPAIEVLVNAIGRRDAGPSMAHPDESSNARESERGPVATQA